MQKIKIIIVSILLSGLVITGTFFVVGYLKPEKAGLLIVTNPKAEVYIDGEKVGTTKYETTLPPGEVVVRLVPEEPSLAPFETKVNLVSGIKTIIKRDFGQTSEDSAGTIVSFEKSFDEEVGLAVISIPDAAQVSIDGQIRGVTPYKNSSLAIGEHTLSITASGYATINENIQTYKGYKLTAVVKLRKSVSTQELNPSPSPTAFGKMRVKILTTPTGYLRVRSEPTTSSAEIGTVSPGEFYDVLEEDFKNGWVKIELKDGQIGWVSQEYTSKEGGLSPTITPLPSPPLEG